MAKVIYQLSAINCGAFFKGSISIKEDGCAEIQYDWKCGEIYQKKPTLSFYSDETMVFKPDREITPEYDATLNKWQRAILSFKNDIYQIILLCKKENHKQFYALREIDLEENLLNDLAS